MMAGVLAEIRSIESVHGTGGFPEGKRRCFTTSEDADEFMDAFVSSGTPRA